MKFRVCINSIRKLRMEARRACTQIKTNRCPMLICLFFLLSILTLLGSYNERTYVQSSATSSRGFLFIGNQTESEKEETFLLQHYPKIPREKFALQSDPTLSRKILVITHLSGGFIGAINVKIPMYTFTFTSMMYASWKYVLMNYDWTEDPSRWSKIDLLVYYSNTLTGEDLPEDCLQLTQPSDLRTKESSCFKRPIPEGNFSYVILDQFSFLKDSDLSQFVSNYDYVMRTDPDIFLTPSFFTWKLPHTAEIVFGRGGYSTEFNRKLLDRIAKEDFKWKRQGLGSIGSTWIVKQNKFVELCSKIAFATYFVHENCFDTSRYPEIRPYMEKNRKLGSWPEWWRHVSSMYGGDLAIQHMFPKLTEEVNQPALTLDTHSSFTQTFLEAKHIHAFHTDEKFNKFALYSSVPNFCSGGQIAEKYQQLRSLDHIGHFNVNMTIPDYAGNISMYGAVQYFKRKGCF